MIKEYARRKRISIIVLTYPFAVLLISTVINLFIFGVKPAVTAVPHTGYIYPLIIAAVLLLINHSWLMTTTELIRAKYHMYATPEEWATNGLKKDNAPIEGLQELERRHNAHRNTTENSIYFVFLAMVLVLISPTILAAQIWIIGFSIARLGYTYSYLNGKDDARGIFMSFSLMSLYGMAGYLVISMIV